MKKLILRVGLLLMVIISTLSCSKKNDDDRNWSEELKNSVWAGIYQLTSGAYRGEQPFSVEFNADGSVQWSDITCTRPASQWAAVGDTLTITFPNSTTVTSILSGDRLTKFVSGPGAGLVINEASRAALVTEEKLVNAQWAGTQGSFALTFDFIPGGKVTYKKGGEPGVTVPYTIAGAGIRISRNYTPGGGKDYSVLLENGSVFKGLDTFVFGLPPETTYTSFTVAKQ
ncbi:MAG: hypothetical protein EOO05_09040 [Chitinophagaceae bacterium]|nr:MAG: hypothetical protein EOO05_09040 [Chitinophagaceae bacterium]